MGNAPKAGCDDSLSHPAPTLSVKDADGRELLCFLEQLVPVAGEDFGLLSPVDTPVCLFHLPEEGGEPELIDDPESLPQVLSIADVVLREHYLCLVRSAVTLTVSGELEQGDAEEPDDASFPGDDEDEDGETYEQLVTFMSDSKEYGLYIPLDPFFVLARLERDNATLVEGDDFERLQPLVEKELEALEGNG